MNSGFDIPWMGVKIPYVGGSICHAYGFKVPWIGVIIPWVGGQYNMDRVSICHG